MSSRRLQDGRHHLVLADDAVLERARQHPDAETLGEHQQVAGLGAGVVDDLVRARHAGDGEAVLGLLVVDRVPAGQLGAGLDDLLGAAAQHLGEMLHVQIDGPGDEVHGRQRPRAHGVDVTQRVGRRQLAEPVRRVDDGREEVDRLHQAEVVGEARDGGVVARLEQPRELR